MRTRQAELAELRLLCGPHNRRLNQGWRLEPLPDRRYAVHPPKCPGQPAIRRLSAQGSGMRF